MLQEKKKKMEVGKKEKEMEAKNEENTWMLERERIQNCLFSRF